MTEVPTNQLEALSLLRKWKEEKRVIHASVSVARGALLIIMLCRLDEVTDIAIRLRVTKATNPLGEHTFINLELTDAEFEFDVAENAPEPLKSKMAGHDSLLYIYLPRRGVSVRLAVLPPLNELAMCA